MTLRRPPFLRLVTAAALALASGLAAGAESSPPPSPPTAPPAAQPPPPGVEVVSWYVMMGIGQVVTLRVPPEKLRDVNLIVENGAWGAFHTEFYPTYDYRPIWEEQRKKRR